MRSKISALGVKRTLIILAESLFIISLFFVSGAVIKNDAEASYNNKSRTFNSSYYFDRYRNFYNSVGQHIVDRRRITSGYTYVDHTVGMTAGGYSVNIGDPIRFAHTPTLTFVNYGGAWDTPYGTWCSNINSKCTSGWGGIAYDGISSNYAYVHWTGLRPGASMTSSNPSVISCSGMNCTALRSGTATLTATGASTPTRIWVYTGFANNTNWVYTSETHEASLNGTTYANNKMTIGGGVIGSWNVVVTDPNNPPIAVIDEIYNNRTNAGPFYTSELVNFRGTATDSDGSVVAYRWGTSCGDNSYSSTEDPDNLTLPGTAGSYMVYFRAQDNRGAWSACDVSAVQTITVIEPPSDGACGTANGVTYPAAATNYGLDTQCAPGGVSSNTNFPEAGTPARWTCLGSNGVSSPECVAAKYGSPSYQCQGVTVNCRETNPATGNDYCGGCTSPEVCPDIVISNRQRCEDTNNNSATHGQVDESNCTAPSCNTTGDISVCTCSEPPTDITNWIEVPANQ